MVKVTMQQLLEAGVHFGHQTSRWNPKMKPFIYGARGGIHIIDLEKTAHMMNKALNFLRREVEKGKVVLFVSTKQQTRELLPKIVNDCGMMYVVDRWLGGFLTNFKTIHKRIAFMRDMESQKQTGELKKYTKKEALMIDREVAELNKIFAGVKNLDRLPDVLFVIDPVRDIIAVREAKRAGIPVVAFVDTNADPYLVEYPIPANDDGMKSLELLLTTVGSLIKDHAPVKIKAPTADAALVPQSAIAEKGDAEALSSLPKKATVKKTPKTKKEETGNE